MKKIAILSFIITQIAAVSFAGNLNDALRTFEDNPGYSSPVATYMGTMHNAQWIATTRIDKKMGFSFGLDMNTAFLSQSDVEYDYTYKTNCAELKADPNNAAVTGFCPEYADAVTLPTIFGGSTQHQFTDYVVDVNNRYQPLSKTNANEGLVSGSFLGLPNYLFMPYFFAGYSQEHTELKAKFMYVPVSMGDHTLSLGIYGLGINHDLAHYANYTWPVDVSVYANTTLWSLSYENAKNTGALKLNGLAYSYGVATSKRWGNFELIGLIGMESSSFDSSGEILIDGDPNDKIEPKVTVDGLNSFKASLNMTFHFDTYKFQNSNPIGAQRGHNFSVFNYHHQSK